MNTILTLRKAIEDLMYIAKNMNIDKDSYALAIIYNSISLLVKSQKGKKSDEYNFNT